jgi:hypothetical protein
MKSDAWFFISVTLFLAVVAATVVAVLLSTDQPPQRPWVLAPHRLPHRRADDHLSPLGGPP